MSNLSAWPLDRVKVETGTKPSAFLRVFALRPGETVTRISLQRREARISRARVDLAVSAHGSKDRNARHRAAILSMKTET
jgi:hypothetical protein